MTRSLYYLGALLCAPNTLNAQVVSNEAHDSSSIIANDNRSFGGNTSVLKAVSRYDSVDSLKAEVKRMVDDYFDIHYGCAPMTYVGLSRLLGSPLSDEQLHRQSSSFSGGLGGSKKGTCGALSGAVMALNNYANGDSRKLGKHAREVYDALHDKYGNVVCEAIRTETSDGKRCAECVGCCLCVMNKVIDILYREGDLQLNTIQYNDLLQKSVKKLK